MKKIIIVLLSAIMLTLGSQAAFAEENVFAPDEHCLAYKTEKSMFFFDGVEVIGKSCEVKAEIRWQDSTEQAQVEVSVPVTSLDSANSFRDGEMPEILKAELSPNIRFISNWLSRTDMQKMLENQSADFSGMLEVAGNTFPVKFALSFKDQGAFYLIEGKLITSFSELKVEVPTVGPGGLLAEPRDYLELLVHLRSDKISGTEKIALSN
ncbi:MAG: YceI family protein [Proteobacteria bacterium]|jgi:polyisoprenoid-binding protein YceI|nr:YceI family protein [Pseudomonadota bacterium]